MLLRHTPEIRRLGLCLKHRYVLLAQGFVQWNASLIITMSLLVVVVVFLITFHPDPNNHTIQDETFSYESMETTRRSGSENARTIRYSKVFNLLLIIFAKKKQKTQSNKTFLTRCSLLAVIFSADKSPRGRSDSSA